MTENIREYISVLMDDEIPHGQLNHVLDRLEQEPELRRCWVSYHLINDALRSNLPDSMDRQFADRVLSLLETESRVRVPFILWRPAFRDAVGLAMAASLAAVTVVVTQWFGGEHRAGPPTAVATSDSTRPPLIAQATPSPSPPPTDERFNSYLIDHSAYAAASGMQGMMPYVRVVGYGYK